MTSWTHILTFRYEEISNSYRFTKDIKWKKNQSNDGIKIRHHCKATITIFSSPVKPTDICLIAPIDDRWCMHFLLTKPVWIRTQRAAVSLFDAGSNRFITHGMAPDVGRCSSSHLNPDASPIPLPRHTQSGRRQDHPEEILINLSEHVAPRRRRRRAGLDQRNTVRAVLASCFVEASRRAIYCFRFWRPAADLNVNCRNSASVCCWVAMQV